MTWVTICGKEDLINNQKVSNLVDKHPCWLPPLASLYKENWNIVIYQTIKFILNIWKNL